MATKTDWSIANAKENKNNKEIVANYPLNDFYKYSMKKGRLTEKC